MTWNEWLIEAIIQLSSSETPKLDAEILLMRVTNATRTQLIAFSDTLLSNKELIELDHLLIRRQNREPIAYLTKECEFWSLDININSSTFIPRPDTECLVEQALKLLPINMKANVLDLGTGTGAIALAIASERPKCQLTGIDIQPHAVSIAIENSINLRLTNVEFLHGDWFKPINKQRYSLIVSNPPYIDAKDPHLVSGSLRFEPRNALVSQDLGMADIKTICHNAPSYLLPGAWLLIEHGWQQGKTVSSLLSYLGFSQISTIRDYGNNERVSMGKMV